jgi:CheY-like chemotaxis protein
MSRPRILVAEDNPGDVFLIREALKEHDVRCEFVLAEDGEQARTLLENLSAGTGQNCPDLIVLDINLPKMNGIAVLEFIREKDSCSRTPVMVLTSSGSPVDRERVLRLGVEKFVQKPAGFDDFMNVGAIIKALLGTPPHTPSLL